MKEYLKRNKALFILPLALLPFVVLIFYVLGGGTDIEKEGEKQSDIQNEGVNYALPEAEKSIEIYDKMEAYQKDDQQLAEVAGMDVNDTAHAEVVSLQDTTIEDNTLLDQNADQKAILAHIQKREKQLQKELNPEEKPVEPIISTRGGYRTYPVKKAVKQPERVQAQVLHTGIKELDQIVDQNIRLNRQNDSLESSLGQARYQLDLVEARQSKAFTLGKELSSAFNREESEELPVIRAEIYETTTVLTGNRIKLRLLEETRIRGQKIPRNTFVYGICKIKNERLLIEITQMPVKENFVPVKLSICDLDGMEGLYVPDNAARKVYQEVGASTNTSSLMGVTADPLTYAGIRAADRAAQTMLKRVRLKKVTVTKNTRVYIINQK
ncbi:MAG: conjugative transposon protein TraM [Draconibacterium sp.]